MNVSKLKVTNSCKGEWNICCYDDSMASIGAPSVNSVVLEGLNKASARVICNKANEDIMKLEKENQCNIGIFYFIDNPYDHDMGEMYGGESVLMNS